LDFIKKLCLFKQKYGHSNVPQKYRDKWLSKKVSMTRDAYKKGLLEQSQIDELNTLGFIWDTSVYKYNVFIEKLEAFCLLHGHCIVPKSYNDKWFFGKYKTIKQTYKKGTLPQWVTNKLISLNFNFETKPIFNPKNLELLETFMLEHGHCNVPYNYKDKSLFIKVNTIRKSYKKGTLPQWVIDKLEQMGFKWSLKK
jgi:hypothetical protein